jgi:hypothetical protein
MGNLTICFRLKFLRNIRLLDKSSTVCPGIVHTVSVYYRIYHKCTMLLEAAEQISHEGTVPVDIGGKEVTGICLYDQDLQEPTILPPGTTVYLSNSRMLGALGYDSQSVDAATLYYALESSPLVSIPGHTITMLTNTSAAIVPPDAGAKHLLDSFCCAHDAMIIDVKDGPDKIQLGTIGHPRVEGGIFADENLRFVLK